MTDPIIKYPNRRGPTIITKRPMIVPTASAAGGIAHWTKNLANAIVSSPPTTAVTGMKFLNLESSSHWIAANDGCQSRAIEIFYFREDALPFRITA
jgi:hypothetical protein